MDRAELDALPRENLVLEAGRAGVKRPEVMTRVELVDEIIRLTTSNPVERKKARGWLGVARDLVASVVEQGLNLPDAAAMIRGEVRFVPQTTTHSPVATVTLAEIYGAQNHHDRALKILDEVIDKEPDHEAALRLRERLTRERDERRRGEGIEEADQPEPEEEEEAFAGADGEDSEVPSSLPGAPESIGEPLSVPPEVTSFAANFDAVADERDDEDEDDEEDEDERRPTLQPVNRRASLDDEERPTTPPEVKQDDDDGRATTLPPPVTTLEATRAEEADDERATTFPSSPAKSEGDADDDGRATTLPPPVRALSVTPAEEADDERVTTFPPPVAALEAKSAEEADDERVTTFPPPVASLETKSAEDEDDERPTTFPSAPARASEDAEPRTEPKPAAVLAVPDELEPTTARRRGAKDNVAVFARTSPATATFYFEIASRLDGDDIVVRVVEACPRPAGAERIARDIAPSRAGDGTGTASVTGLEPGSIVRAALGVGRGEAFRPLAVAAEVRVAADGFDVTWAPRRGIDYVAVARRSQAALTHRH